MLSKLTLYSPFVFLGGFFCLYLFTAPHTVQTLDTGELVANSYLFRISHPPGYPLFTWIYGLITHIPFHDSVFFRASFLTIICSLVSLFFLFKRNFLAFLPLLLLLGSSKVFWQYAILPDVFMLHVLFIAMILFFYFKEKNKNLTNDFIIVLLFALAATHHQTIIFLSPILIHVLIRSKFNIKIIAPLILVPIVYSTLFLLDIDQASNPYSIKKDFVNLINYILRKEYGTFNLIEGSYQNFFFEYLYFTLIKWKFTLLIAFAYLLDFKANRKIKADKRHFMLFLSLLFYILIFFNLANIIPVGFFNEIMERFTLMPVILILSIVIALKPEGIKNRSLAIFVFLAGVFLTTVNISSNYSSLNFAKNTTLSYWAEKRLDAAKDKNTIIISSRDDIFALRYVRDILGQKKGTLVVGFSKIKSKQYFERVKKVFPDLNGGHKNGMEFIKNNIDNFNFDVDFDFRDKENYKITVHKIGRTISKGKGIYFEPIQGATRKIKAFNSEEFNWIDAIGARFCHYYMFKGVFLYRVKNKKQEALENFKKATEVVDFCQPAYERICKLFKEERTKYCPLAIDNAKFKSYFK